MKYLRNHKGMTLIEIIITLFIASIILVMSSSILLSSMGFFDQHAVSDYDKSTLDSAFSQVSDQLEYASGITISATPLSDKSYENWSYYRIKNGRLYYRATADGDERDLYTDAFYHKRQMMMQVQMKDKDKLYLYMGLKEDDRIVYDRQNTLSLSVVTVRIENNESEGITAPDKKVHTDVYVYFQRQHEEESGNIPEDGVPGTVADEKYCLENNQDAYKGDFKIPADYDKGDFVTYNGILYRAQKNINANNPAFTPDVMNTGWKRIDENWNQSSEYQKGDIIIFGADEHGNHVYYQSLTNHNVAWQPDMTIGHSWVKLDPSEVPKEHACRVTWD
ncbi:MAG: prepilin-type N-terminal cleavage/methylation domain-containing protein [Erysipelotrichaceae bacterium]|nr:prepilin-type N-terminal cleavage/methylation domain-containing protein [Erysipelotrichaceae bacterium]